ncbi:hypothetical protein MRX96_005368 [Rhipicephalus microplus]
MTRLTAESIHSTKRKVGKMACAKTHGDIKESAQWEEATPTRARAVTERRLAHLCSVWRSLGIGAKVGLRKPPPPGHSAGNEGGRSAESVGRSQSPRGETARKRVAAGERELRALPLLRPLRNQAAVTASAFPGGGVTNERSDALFLPRLFLFFFFLLPSPRKSLFLLYYSFPYGWFCGLSFADSNISLRPV